MTAKKKPGPDTVSPTYQTMAPRFFLARSLLGGTETMRAAGHTFLPQHEMESKKNYKVRLGTNVLQNYFCQTLDNLCSRPFSKGVQTEDIPPVIEPFLDDVDLQGNSLYTFLRSCFREGFALSMSMILVEYPRVQEKPDGAPQTMADDKEQGRRPYLVQVCPENVIFASSTVENGKEILTQVRIAEETLVESADGWEQVCEKRIRVLKPGKTAVYLFNSQKKQYVLEEEWDTGLDEIALVVFYAGTKEGLMLSNSPLVDLANMNVEHWQSRSDQRNVLTVARFPMLAASGLSVTEGQSVTVGPNQLLSGVSKDSKYYYVEHTGAAIESGAKDLQSLEEAMASYGAIMLRKSPGNVTATARALDSAEASSPLQAATIELESVAQQALELMCKWVNFNDFKGKISLNKEFGIGGDAVTVDALFKAREARDLSRKTYLAELKRRDILSQQFDYEDEVELLSEELGDGLPGMSTPAPVKQEPTKVDPNAGN
jgi:hypothetical protein